MASQPTPYLTPEQYLELDSRAERPSEYFDGELFEVQASSLRHNQISANLMRLVGNQLLDSACQPMGSTMRVAIPRRKYCYPDLVVACGTPELAAFDTLLNPTLVIEILSKSTENFDLGRKADMYRSIPSLKEYVVIEQSRAGAKRYVRQTGLKWVLEEILGLDSILILESVHCEIALSELYLRVELDPDA